MNCEICGYPLEKCKVDNCPSIHVCEICYSSMHMVNNVIEE